MNKRLLKYFWALPLLGMLSSCSESAVSEGSQNSRNAVQFAVTASKQTDTRAIIVDNYLVKKKPFGLFAYHGSGWTQNTPPATAPNFFNNQEVSHNGNNWSYSPLMFWTDDKVSFFGYWPVMDGVTKQLDAQGTTYVSTASAVAGSMPKVEFTQQMDASNMVDFIVSNNAIDKTKNDGTVNLEFNHVLTRLNFFARSDRDLSTTTTKIYITGLRILGSTDNTSSKFFNKATFVLGDGGTDDDGHWLIEDSDNPTKEAGKLDVSGILAKEDVTSSAQENGAAYQASAVPVNTQGLNTELLSTVKSTYQDDVDANGAATVRQNYLFMIPPRGKAGIEDKDIMVELDYDVVTENPDINGLVAHNVGKRVSLKAGTLVQGKAYNIIFTVGLNVVDVDVNVADWDTDEIVNASEVDAADNTAPKIIEAWDKLNKIKASLKDGDKEATNYFIINVKNTPDAQLDLRTTVDAGVVDLSAFELGDQVELLFKDGDGKALTYDKGALVPNGWFYDKRTVNGTDRYIMTKVTNYITKVAENNADAIATALTQLNEEKASHTGIHYYAVNVYGTAPATLNLTTVGTAPELGNFKDDDYIYIYFNTDAGGDKTYTAPTGWEIVKISTDPIGKYRLQKKTASQTSNIAIGNTGFVAGSTINVNK